MRKKRRVPIAVGAIAKMVKLNRIKHLDGSGAALNKFRV
jgi:hypothetical protein